MTPEEKVQTVREVLEALGFGTDEPISGSECVAVLSDLYHLLFIRENLQE